MIATRDARAIVHLIVERAVVEPVEQPPHRLLGIGEDVAHVGGDDLRRRNRARSSASTSAPRAQAASCAFRSDMLRSMLRAGHAPGAEQRADLGFAEMALVDQQRIVDQHAFLVDRAAVGRHRARRDPADVGMVAARRDESATARAHRRRRPAR